MDILSIMAARHSVRKYRNEKIGEDVRRNILTHIANINKETGLHIQVFFDEPKCFGNMLAHYGSFANVNNYISIVGEKGHDLEEKAGYYGEMLVLAMQEMGLNSCWVALTHGKTKAIVNKHEKEVIIIAFGYGMDEGHPHRSKFLEKLCRSDGPMPDWFDRGMRAVLYAPTAMNQQKFFFEWDGKTAKAKIVGIGPCTKIDFGIVKYHFESASGHVLSKYE